MDPNSSSNAAFVYIRPKRCTLQHRLKMEDKDGLDFITRCLSVDPANRLTSQQALEHPWLALDDSDESAM